MKNAAIQIRASDETKALLNRAASIRGQSLSEFVVQSARKEAETAIIDQQVFLLDDKQWGHLMAILDAPAEPNDRLIKTMRAKAPWDQ
jgi:uncharacterized protein (DUF1778 family)